jgi:hypothetical protein
MPGSLELIITACLLASPGECAEHRLRLTIQGGDPGQCMYSSPPRVARWVTMHPRWKVQSWRCALVSDDELA